MISCKRAAELISLSLDAPLSLGQRISLAAHMCICGMCRRFRRQSRIIQEVGKTVGEPLGDSLSDEARDRIRRALNDATPQ